MTHVKKEQGFDEEGPGFTEDIKAYSRVNLKREIGLFSYEGIQENDKTTFYSLRAKKPEYMIKEAIEDSELSKSIDEFIFNIHKNPREEKRYYPKKAEIYLVCTRPFNKYEFERLVRIADSFNYRFSKEDMEDFRQIEKRR